jgi:hypothetical protein
MNSTPAFISAENILAFGVFAGYVLSYNGVLNSGVYRYETLDQIAN